MTKANPADIRHHIKRAIFLTGGAQRDLANAVGLSQHAIYHALKVGRVSAELAGKIHEATKGLVSRETLRPDIYHNKGYDHDTLAI